MKRRLGLVVAGLLGLSLGFRAEAARACGGFFCSASPINQAGEKILFMRDETQMTTFVQIRYQGQDSEFSWVVPVPALPTLSVSSDEVFTRLEQATRVSYQLQYAQNEGSCNPDNRVFAGGVSMPTAVEAPAGVTVVGQQVVGPYDSAILKADSVGELETWLSNNHYVIPPRFDEVTKTYLKAGNYFVALKLRPDRTTSDLAPIVLNYKNTEPCIPLIMTSIAAQANMPITAYVLGPARAVPVNYRHVQLNESLIDWLGSGRNYNSLVTQAVGEAGGRAFVTDFAGKSSTARSRLQSTYDLSGLGASIAAWEAVQIAQRFPRGSQLASIMQRDIPVPDSLKGQVDATTLFSDPYAYQGALTQETLDASASTALKQDLDQTYVQPLKTAYDAFGRIPYLTRFYTTMSPADMTVDPILSYNPDLPDVSNVRTATATVLCEGQRTYYDAPIRITLSNGTSFVVTRKQAVKAPGMPASAIVEQLSPDDRGVVVQDNQSAIASLLGKYATEAAVAAAQAAPGCGCHNPSAPASPMQGSGEAALYGVAYMGVLNLVRRRPPGA